MKILFITNIISFHQTALWLSFLNAFDKKDKLDFVYVVTGSLSDERKKMKYDENKVSGISFYETKEHTNEELKGFFEKVDLAFVGSIDDVRVRKYVRCFSKVVYMFEHIKKKRNIVNQLSVLKFSFELNGRISNQKVCFLCLSSFLKNDFKYTPIYKLPFYNFGYFPELLPCYDYESKESSVLWVGRMLDWKRPILAIKLFKTMLSLDGSLKLIMVGDGPEKGKIIEYIEKNGLKNKIFIYDFEDHASLMERFFRSKYYLFTSNKQEGWGVVLNEALSAGCITFASSLAGSTNNLIRDTINGFVFSNKKEALNKISKVFSLTDEEKKYVSNNATKTIDVLWNCSTAGIRLAYFSKCFVLNKPLPEYKDGPLSIVK